MKANKHLLYCHSSHLHFEKVENLNCLFHPELTDNDYILEKAKSLGDLKLTLEYVHISLNSILQNLKKIFPMVCRLLSNCTKHEEDCTNFFVLLRKSEL